MRMSRRRRKRRWRKAKQKKAGEEGREDRSQQPAARRGGGTSLHHKSEGRKRKERLSASSRVLLPSLFLLLLQAAEVGGKPSPTGRGNRQTVPAVFSRIVCMNGESDERDDCLDGVRRMVNLSPPLLSPCGTYLDKDRGWKTNRRVLISNETNVWPTSYVRRPTVGRYASLLLPRDLLLISDDGDDDGNNWGTQIGRWVLARLRRRTEKERKKDVERKKGLLVISLPFFQ